MRNHVNRLGGALAVVALVGAGAIALDVGPTVITDVEPTTQTMWIPVDASGEVVRVDTVAGEVTGRVEVADPGNRLEVYEGDEDLAVVDATVGTVFMVDPGLEQVSREIQTGLTDFSQVDGSPAGFALAAGDEVALVDPDVSTVSTVVAAGAVTSIAVGPEGAVVAGDQGVATIGLDETRVWDRDAEGPVVVRAGEEVVWTDGSAIFDLDGRTRACLDGEVADGSLWWGTDGMVVATDSDAGSVHIVDIDNGRCRSVRLADPGATAEYGRPVVAHGHVFVPEPATRSVHIVDAASEEPPSTALAALTGDSLRLHEHDGLVIAHDRVTQVGSVLSVDGLETFIDTSGEEGSLALSVVGGGDAAVQGDVDASQDGAAPGAGDRPADTVGLTDSPLLEGVDLLDPADESIDESVLSARFAFSDDLVTVGDVVEFLDESTGGPTSWIWDFGDGSGAEGPEVSTSWSTPGTYIVTLFVSDGTTTSEESHPIVVVAEGTLIRPSANFDFSSAVVDVGSEIQFTDTSTGEVDSRRWDFGDGSTSADSAPRKSWSAAGRYSVSLTVANEAGSATASVEIRVVADLQPPDARIVVGSTSVVAGDRVEFAAGSAGGPASFSWDFGDGGQAVGPAVGHVFVAPGSRTVTLTAENGAGRAVDTVVIDVAARTLPPVARIAGLPPLVEVGETVTLTSLSSNSPDVLRWDFADGSTGQGATVQHQWAVPGAYRISLTAENVAGSNIATATLNVVAELPAPVASFSPPTTVRVGEPATFVSTSSDATSHEWDFGDGATAATANATHAFASSGPHDVQLTVHNRNGTHTTTRTVDVKPALPVAAFSWSPLAPDTGEPVNFTDLSSGAVSWEWNFGDGSPTVISASPSHAFAAAIAYDVTLTVRNAAGESASVTRSVTVDPAPPSVGPITASPATGVAQQPVTFNAALSGGPVTSREWTVNGAVVGTGPSLAYTFASAGTYSIGTRATGPGGIGTTAPLSFTVVNPPAPVVAGVTMSVVTPQTNQPVTFTAVPGAASGPINSWQWRVDGVLVPGGSPTLVRSFATAGPHSVQAIAVGPVVSAPSPVRNFTVVPPPPVPPVLGAISGPQYINVGTSATFSAPHIGGGAPTSWTWTYGDGTSGSSPSHFYGTPGNYTVGVTATNAGGPSNTVTKPITVVQTPSVSAPVASPSNPIVGQNVTFNVAVGGITGPLSYQWTVDGVSAGSEASLVRSFATPGSHTVTVRVEGPTGLSGTNSTSINVNPAPQPPIADFTWTPPLPVVGAVTFINQSSNASSYSWSFGDGNTSVAVSPIHVYGRPGSYQVTLTATGPGGTDPITKTVVVS